MPSSVGLSFTESHIIFDSECFIRRKYVHEEDIIKQETPGVEESAVIVVECTTVKEVIKEENMVTDDPLSVQVKHNFELLLYIRLVRMMLLKLEFFFSRFL